MRITTHGRERILGRTKMPEEDLIRLLNSRVTVQLSETEDTDFLLFWSPFDRSCKIALMARDRTLISVWETYFVLPEGVRKPTAKDRRTARKLFEASLRKQKERKQPVKRPFTHVTIDIHVTRNKRVLFSHAAGTFEFEQVRDSSNLISTLAPIFRVCIEALERHPEQNPYQLSFLCVLKDAGTRFEQEHNFKYVTVRKKLVTA